MLLNRPITAIMLMLAVFIFGGIALSELSVNLLPEVDTPTMMVRTGWSGAAPREVEQRINEPLEALLSTVRGLQDIHSFARQGQSIISLRFKWGQNMDLSFLNVREKLDQVRRMLPQEADRPQLIQNSASDKPIAVLGIRQKGTNKVDFETRLQLKRWANQVMARRLEQADGIAQVVLVGAVEPEVQIRYRPERLNRYGVSLGQVRSLVKQANLFTATGELRDGWYRYSLKIQSRIQSLDDIRKVPLTKLGQGKVLTLRDVAQVRMDEADPTSFALVDGHRVLNALVKKEYGANTVEVFDTLNPLLKQLQQQYPDVNITVLREQASFIRNTIHNLLQTLIYGAVLAFIVLFLFLDDLRTPFTIGVAIPVSIFLTFFVMYLSGIQLNIVSLSGLTLGIGLLVDNAIIVLENINRHRQITGSMMEAASRGTREIAMAVSASTFTTISVFLPLVFLGGFEGAFFKDQAWTLSISLLASLGVALAILPVLVVQLQKKRRDATGQSLNFTHFFDRVKERYEEGLQWAMKHRGLMIGGTLFLLAGTTYIGLIVAKRALPQGEPRELTFRVRMPGNTALTTSRDAAASLTYKLESNIKGIQQLQALGGYTDQSNLARLSEEGFNKFRLVVPVLGQNQAGEVRRSMAGLQQQYPDWTLREAASQGSGSFGNLLNGESQAPVLFRLVGTDRSRNEQLAGKLQQYFKEHGRPLSMHKEFEHMVGTYQIRFKKQRMLQLGITEQQVIQYLESMTRGSRVTDWDRQDENIAIRLVGLNRQIHNPGNVVMKLNGQNIPLREVATVQKTEEPEQLERVNQTPVLSYITGMSFAGWWWNASEIRSLLQHFSQETGAEIKVGGSAIELLHLLDEMGLLLGISVLIIYIILAIQFESLRYPMIIILAVPFAWVGSILILYFTGSSLNALSFMGILILTGIAVNDSILKVDFMRRYYEDTGNLDQAIQQAGRHRFRPVVMTSLTTIFGLIPMLLPYGDGYEFRQSLALALMGGMVTSTLLTLFIIPIIFQWTEGNEQLSINNDQ